MKYVEVKLDKVRKLRFTSNAFAELERELKRPLGRIIAPFANIGSDGEDGLAAIEISVFRAMLWAALRWEDPTLTVSAVGDLMDESMENGDFDKVTAAIGEALSKSGFFMQLTAQSKASENGQDDMNSPVMTADSDQDGWTAPPTK